MNSARLIQLCANLEAKIDTRLFAKREDEEKRSATPRTNVPAVIARGAARNLAVGGALIGAYKAAPYVAGGARAAGHLARGVAGDVRSTVANRVGGMRATVPGFAQRSRAGQTAAAVGSIGGDIGRRVRNEASYHGAKVGRYAENAAAGIRKRIGGIVAKIK